MVDVLRFSLTSEIVVQTTEDEKYEYFLEVINSSQKNSRAQLFIRDVTTKEETRMPLKMKNKRLRFNPASTSSVEDAWSHLKPSDISSSIYILTTFNRRSNNEIETFEIDMEKRTSRRIE